MRQGGSLRLAVENGRGVGWRRRGLTHIPQFYIASTRACPPDRDVWDQAHGAGRRAAAAERIALCNDAFRQSLDPDQGYVRFDGSLKILTSAERAALLARLAGDDAFGPGDDLYGERDRGALVVDGRAVTWRIDCLDLSMEQRSADPGDPRVTVRVLTLRAAV